MYKLLNDLPGKGVCSRKAPFLSSLGEKNPSTEKIANAFNDYFANIGKNISKNYPWPQ